MENPYLYIIILLSILAIGDLIVGVSNDAVNFLNSAIGSKAISIRNIMIIASIGVFFGAITSSGMMEVARKGIFNPEMFMFQDIMFIFMAVMITDILLLDVFNTLGMPTSTTVSIVSGTLAERIKLWPFFLFAAILSGIIYPIVMGWQWGGGWLASIGFSDFAGSTLVHSTGGAAALAGIIILGPRFGRFDSKGMPKAIKPFAASSIPLVTIGVFVLWLGWFGFNGGSQLSMGTADDAIAVSTIFLNTFLAGAGGVMAAATVHHFLFCLNQ